MSIKLRFEKGSLVVVTSLEDEALNELLKLVQQHQSAEPVPPTAQPYATTIEISPTPSGDTQAIAKQWLWKHTASEVLNLIGWTKNPEKILLLGAHIEAGDDNKEGWKNSDLVNRFGLAKEALPGNFSRDISLAVKNGLLASVTKRSYKVSRTGWNTVAEAIGKITKG